MPVHRPASSNSHGALPVRIAVLFPLISSTGAPAPAQQRAAAPHADAFVGSSGALADAWAFDLVPPTAAQSELAPTPRPSAPPRRGWSFEVAGFSDAVELESLSVYDDDWYDDDATKLFEWDDVDRTRYGGRILAGIDQFRFGVEIFTERFDASDRFSGTGGDMMALATPTLLRGRDWSWFADSGVHIGYVRDHGEVDVVTRFGSLIVGHATLDYEYAQFDLGTGLRFHDLEIAAGMRIDDTLGYFDLDDGNDYYVAGTNYAFYSRLGYRSSGFPVFANATLFLGEVRGAAFVVGVRF